MKKVLLVAVSVLLVCTSCVTKKKYLLAENGRLEAIARGDDLQNQLVNCRDNNDGLTSRLASLERDTTRMGKNIRNYQSMLNTNMTEQEKLNSLLSQKMNELDERERNEQGLHQPDLQQLQQPFRGKAGDAHIRRDDEGRAFRRLQRDGRKPCGAEEGAAFRRTGAEPDGAGEGKQQL